MVTGRMHTRHSEELQEFESLQEKDYVLLLGPDDDILSVEVQPVRIPVKGVRNGYVPDVLVHYRKELGRPSELTEVKTREDLEVNKEKYAPKFKAAEAYCAERGWIFITKSQEDFPQQRLKNIKWLRGYLRYPPDAAASRRLLAWLAEQGESSTVGELLDAHPDEDGEMLHHFWSCVAHRRILLDLDAPMELDAWIVPGAEP
ncbi:MULTISPECIES: TnsA endonuclease N-terminal domain-containing protein [unclassified Variovorax]|uniref:TnsA endonuclease N-terminal domain-containing protein n=1 Tax=unclassified Variovorax TaxID=663243 RepID=UPI0013E099E7|nr:MULTISPECIES: TnsA endonuclease N-terminal domain-containing protein [unclassified Variovorax]